MSNRILFITDDPHQAEPVRAIAEAIETPLEVISAANAAELFYGEQLSRAILNSMQTRIAVLNEDGLIVTVNESWERFARENGDPLVEYTGVGINYFDVTQRSALLGDSSADLVLQGMRSVLEGKAHHFEWKYPCHSPEEERWFLMRVTPLEGNALRGLVISHIDITAQQQWAREQTRRAIQREQSRQQERELRAIGTLSDGQVPHAGFSAEQEMQLLTERYGELLEKALERRAFRVEIDISGDARALAEALGRQSATPRDVIKIHADALERKRQQTNSTKMQAYLEEGRLLVLEVMGYLAAFYRDLVIANLELRNM